ncbi:MAG: ABC transporter ATP-binding protein [Termitinemataceae bacterium]|nr:MAG: ABC transporter ATP-binding protein [Termitinemataceae bacterium]
MAVAPDTAVEFTDFYFQYNAQSKPTLFDINLSIKRGEKILIAGPSGCGKSTLAHCINGLIPHAFKGKTQGSFKINGCLQSGIFERSKIIGTVLQDTDGQFVGLSAAEDIAFVCENDCVPTALMHQKVLEAARLVHIEDHLNKSPQDLSGGQKQRVSMAGLLTSDVEILLFDEPLANLDPATGQEAIELIDRLHSETKKTIIIIEHRIEDVLHRKVDRVILMAGGRITADMSVSSLFGADILRKAGLREPLYISALRYAGVERPVMSHEGDVSPFATELRSFAIPLSGGAAPATPPPESGGDTILSAQNLSFSYSVGSDTAKTLSDVSFTIKRGECAGLVGKNGAGKSTLAKLISGFITPSDGTISIGGCDIAPLSIKERAEKVGYVMQNPNQMISHPMIFDEAAFALRNRGVAENEVLDRVHEMLRLCGLYQFRKWPVGALSFGQKKRLTIASILSSGAELLIMDEPTAGQDFAHYTEIMEFLNRLRVNQNMSLLFVTHDMHLMLEYCDHALVLADGKLLADETPQNILTDDALIKAANLKRTSLYDMAIKAGIDPKIFIENFIFMERESRKNKAEPFYGDGI